MAYRDDRQALELQLAELTRENGELRDELAEERAKARAARAEDRERRHDSVGRKCTVCGGALLPVAVFAGRNDRQPLPLRMSTLRFVNPSGGFTHAAPILAKACTSCGFIHHFIDMHATTADDAPDWPPPEVAVQASARGHEPDDE
ncbi:hypothetical protein [Paraliomyxa miuraensis]|uniref:hypothetical protein n=1 Tax=Paraliomyxa miuraensis TaxID=376150 RepID=UPI00224F2067|nr:hypothetical protein [Paraliomyxa miuraensis]MCX4240465.1 hypothetical protein [Paraliomyxa miuraensis]